MAMDTDAIPNLLGDLRDDAPDELQHYFISFEDYWERKLWHELTESLLEYFGHSESAPKRIPLYEKFLKAFAAKINQLKLVKLGLGAATQCKGSRLQHLSRFAITNLNRPVRSLKVRPGFGRQGEQTSLARRLRPSYCGSGQHSAPAERLRRRTKAT